MKKHICLLIILVLAQITYAGVPKHEEYSIYPEIRYNEHSGIYEYIYSLYNPENNKNLLRRVIIYIPRDLDLPELSWDNLTFGNGYSSYSSEAIKDKVIAVGLDGPEGWTYGLGFDKEGKGFVGSGSLEGYEVYPGHSINGLILTSYGLPGIRDAEMMPLIDYDNLPDEYYGDVELAKELRDNLIYRTKTIGPTAPPEELVPADFLQSIIDMKHQAMELGWVTNEGIRDSLDAKLDAALKKFQSGNTKAAKNILGAFINEVEAQGCESYADCPKGKHLSPEAYALLKFNAQYLIDNLK